MSRILSLSGLFALVFVLAACGPDRAPDAIAGTIEVTVEGVESAEVTLTSVAGLAPVTETATEGEPVVFENVTPGVYTVSGGDVEGFVTPEAQTVTLAPGATAEVTLSYEEEGMTIADIASATPELSSLVAAVGAANLLETLQGEGPFTVFAPTNDAFDALAESLGVTLDDVLGLPNLADVLLYHVVPGALQAEEILELAPGSVETAAGSPVAYFAEGDDLVLNGDATVTQADIEASNGVIHVIDAVLMPLDAVADVALSGEAEVQPEPVETDASGTAVVFLQGEELTVRATYEGMTIAGPGVHVHGPATEEENAGVLHPLEFDNDTGTVFGTVTLSEEEIGWLMDGLLYLNLHSEVYPAGELRGQIIVMDEGPDDEDDGADDVTE